MSRLDLDVIQSQLKTAIQNHQMLVSRLQLQPQDMTLKTQLHNIQMEIMLMSQKQKSVVQKLRKDLIERKHSSAEDENFDPKNSALSPTIKPSLPSEPSNSPCDNQTRPPPKPVCDTPDKPAAPKSVSSPLRVPQFLPNSCRTPISQNNNNNNTISSKLKTEGIKPADPSPVVQPRKPLMTKSSSIREKQIFTETTPEELEHKQKLEFMASLRLFPPEKLKEMQNKRCERKRKSTCNPNFAYGFELERRPRLSNYLGTDYFGAQKPKSWKADGPSSSPSSSRSNTPEKTTTNGPETQQMAVEHRLHEGECSVCEERGQLLPCDSCASLFHLNCVSPPITAVPEGHWSCKKCQEAHHRSALSLAAVTTYIATKTGREEEKRKLLKRSTELLQEKTNLENRTKELNEILERQGIQKQTLIETNRRAQQSVEGLQNFIKLVQSS